MFKLESYITPIILNHVAKYVKNIRPEDSQVSLWEGEVAFQNLDLRLDVLEEELNLPFEFLSGHIHELSILVPWMKIASEPIKITINTIEFVLKLKDAKAKTDSSPSPKKTEKKRVSKVDDGTQQQGYMPGLVNKIINNIVINCHNIILKYVEEDIVVSMNIQLLSFSSADETWKPAFTDVHPVRIFMRKLVQVSDLTICLDKRNAAGQIDVCQEPILYRCSLEVRIVRKYNANATQLGSTTRVAVFTKLMEMNVSSLQFPMAMRLFKLLMALKAGELKARSTADVHDEEVDPQDGAPGSRSSYLSWALSFIPTFNFSEPEEEEYVEEEPTEPLLDIGIYIEALNFTLKNSEFITDSIVGATKKIRYSPIVKVMLGGIYSETVIISEKNWSNTKGGCSSMAIEPLDAYKDEDAEANSLVYTSALIHKAFLDRSLFDETSTDNWIVTNIQEYNLRVTEEYLLYRSPVVAFDLVDYQEEPKADASLSESEENANRSRVIYRILASSMTLRYNPTYSRITAVLKELIQTYDYPPYSENKAEHAGGSPKLHPPLLDDFDSLMIGIPLKVYKFKGDSIFIEFHAKSEPNTPAVKVKKPAISLRKNLPYFRLSIDTIEGQWTTPLDPNKLVHTTCQLPDKPIELLNACYNNAQIRFKNVALTLRQSRGSAKLCNIPKGSVNFGDLLQPALWKKEEVPIRKLDVAFDSINLEFAKSEVITAVRLVRSISAFDSKNYQKIMYHASNASREMRQIKIRSNFKKLHLEAKKFNLLTMFRGSLRVLESNIISPAVGCNDGKSTLLTTKVGETSHKWAEWYVQIPNECPNDVCTKSVLALWIEPYHLVVDEHLIDFLRYMEPSLPSYNKEPSAEVVPASSTKTKQTSKKSNPSERLTRKICYPEETIHVSSERDEKDKTTEASRDKDFQELHCNNRVLPYIKSLVLKIQIAKGEMDITSGIELEDPSQINFTQIMLPRLVFSSASAEHITRYNIQHELQNNSHRSSTFPWTCGICDFGVESFENNVRRTIVHSIQTSITIAMTHKKEHLERGAQQPHPQSKPGEEPEPEITNETDSESPTSPDLESKSPGAGSVAGNARSKSSEDNEQNKGLEKKKNYLQEAVETVFSTKKRCTTRDVVAISLHVDTAPIHLTFDSKRTAQIREHVTLLGRALSLFHMSHQTAAVQKRNKIEIITINESHADIKHFLEMETNSEQSEVSTERTAHKLIASVLLQWTITKFTMELDASEAFRCKLVLDMEDLISSVDKREDFTKFTAKVGTLSTRFYEKGKGPDLALSDNLRIKVQTTSTQSPLFNMIVTTVGVKNFFKKIGARSKDTDHVRAISEVIVKLEAIEMIFDLDKLTYLAPIIYDLSAPNRVPRKSTAHEIHVSTCPSTASQLPLFHLESKGFTVYLPIKTHKDWCSVAILKVGSIKVSPNLENPLQRSPVRADVFQKAAQMGILGTPGSIIEDRQYEATLGNISAATGNWNQIIAHMKEQTDNFHNTNPAFEWNNQSRKMSMDVRKVFSNFTFIAIYAPCMTCNNVLICGQAIEFNCSNDLVATFTTDQVSLFSCIVSKTGFLLSVIDKSGEGIYTLGSPSQMSIKSFRSTRTHMSGNSYDSLVEQSGSAHGEDYRPVAGSIFIPTPKKSLSRRALAARDKCGPEDGPCDRKMPHTTSFVAGTFIINLFNYKRTVVGIPHGEEPTIEESLVPLLSITLSQPSFLISQTIFEITKRFSLFNFSVNLFHSSLEDDGMFAEERLGPDILFDTKRGDVGTTGIPPPLIVLKSHRRKSMKLDVELSVSKPATIRLSGSSLRTLTKYMIVYYESLLENPCLSFRTDKVIFRDTKIQMMKNMLLNADRFNLKVNMVSVKFAEIKKHHVKLCLVDLRVTTKFLKRPEKLNTKLFVGGLHIQSHNKIAVHPIGVKCNVDFIQESWNRLPLVTASMKLNVIQCDITVKVIDNCLAAVRDLEQQIQASMAVWEEFLQKASEGNHEINRDRLQRLYLPPLLPRTSSELKEEFYQDDLRAGAFQFSEMTSDSTLPMPYQIQIIKKNYGIICWRYPQPRQMSKIHIYPVPMAVPNPIRIKCRMEYYSDPHEEFLHFCDFWLSETVSKSIDLPDREITSHIWRVVILQSLVSINRECFDTSEEDEELRSINSIGIDEILNSVKKESDFILHPKVLVGCMRIDTIFRASSIPKIQGLLNINYIQLNFQAHQSTDSILPTPLAKFKISESNRPVDETFLCICIEKASVHGSFHSSENYFVHSKFTASVKSLDYGYLNLIYIIEPTTLNGYLRVNGVVDANIDVDKLSINFGPSVIHNLVCAKRNWEGYLKEETNRKHYITSKFIVGNRTQKAVGFGQTGTDERILLNPKECCKYSFLSSYFAQKLTFYLYDGQRECASGSLSITLEFPPNEDYIIKHVKIDDRCLVMSMKRLSATQYYILIKGQVELVSMVDSPFLMEFYDNDRKFDHDEIDVQPKARATFVLPVICESNLCIRLKLKGERGKGQTGNIPLRSNKNYPWLVKVPVGGSHRFVSFWVRILRDAMWDLRTDDFHPQQILITIWPIFEIHSMMTCDVVAIESGTKHKFSLAPRGKSYQLSLPATHQTDHVISFASDFSDSPDFNLTLKAIDWNKFFWYDEDLWTVEKTLSELAKPTPLKWPLNDEEELRIKRVCMESSNTTLIYKCAPSREFSCTLKLEVAPWGTFINGSGQDVMVDSLDGSLATKVHSNAIAMLPHFKSEFRIKVPNGIAWVSSLPIVFVKREDTAKRKCHRLNENGSTDIIILRGDQTVKFHLEFHTENERNIFVLKPKYVVANMTKERLVVLPFTLDHKETITEKEILELSKKKLVSFPTATASDYCVGMSLDWFYDSNSSKAQRSADTAFIFFVCIRTQSKSDISIPLALIHPFNRKCFSLQHKELSIPLTASLLEKNGQFFISIFDDASPMILLNNQTDLKLLVGQTGCAENSDVSCTIPEYDGKHFEWYQVLQPRSKLYYTPPISYANFPDVESSVCNLSLAMYSENNTKKKIKWSKAIHTDASWEKFLHVPAHGDVKIVVCDKHRIIRVSIFYIAQQLEFSVKDIRSRLLQPGSIVSSENVASYGHLDDSPSLSDIPLQRVKGNNISSNCIHQSSDHTTVINAPLKIKFTVKEIDAKIFVECKTVDFLKKEIFALYIDDFRVAYDNSKRTLNMQITNLQIDNQLFSSGNYDFPVVLCSQELYKRPPEHKPHFIIKTCAKEPRVEPMAEITAIFYDDEFKIQSVGCRVSPIRAYIEDTYLNDLLDYLVECAPGNVVYSPNYDDFYVTLGAGEFLIPKDIVAQAQCISEPLKMQYFRIDSMNVMLSVHTCVRLYIALDHSPLQFSTYEQRDVLTLPLRFGHTLGMHYLSGALFGAGWVVGSLEMLGSPSGLARSFSLGLKDFVSMPVQGLLRGPWGFVVGVTQGSASLLRNITAGTVNSVSKLAASVSRNLDRLTLDNEHIQRTEALRRCRPQGFAEGFTQGITGLGISILGAVGGIARHTLEARSTTEVLTGVGKGIVGAFAKPISGAAELLALTGQGVLHTVGFNAMPQQRAPSVPRNIAAHASKLKVWNLLLKLLPSPMKDDQVLFAHEVTFVVNEKLRAGSIFLTSTVMALYETERNKFTFVNPVHKLEISVDPNDNTLLSVSLKMQPNELDESAFYTTQRIMNFIESSSTVSSIDMTTESLEDFLKEKESLRKRSFYISEHLGQFLIEYLVIINKINS